MPSDDQVLCPQCWKTVLLQAHNYQSDNYIFHHGDAVKPVAAIMKEVGHYQECTACLFGAWCITYSLSIV
jgi:hypothetical protein